MWKLFWLGALGLALASGPAMAQQGQPSAARGQHLAEVFCARCHVIAPNTGASWTDAPDFEVIARDGSKNQRWFRRFFTQPHWHMLGTDRSQPEADDIAAYIASLRR